MLDAISFRVLFSKEIPKGIPTTPGGFSFRRKDGKEIKFDFNNSLTECDGRSRIFYMDELDLDSFDGSENITSKDVKEMLEFEDIFVDMDECPDDVSIDKVEWFEFIFFENKDLIKVNVDQSILDDYSERM